MRVAVYARVSTSDKEQDPETQLIQLRDIFFSQGWQMCSCATSGPGAPMRSGAPPAGKRQGSLPEAVVVILEGEHRIGCVESGGLRSMGSTSRYREARE
jgi:hypothetical protein